jgi:hypothetical protein
MGVFGLAWFAIQNYAVLVIKTLTEPFAWIAVFLLFIQCKKLEKIQKVMYLGKPKYKVFDMFMSSLLFGIIAGLISSIIITVFGVTSYNSKGIEYLLLLSLMLMMINPRYVCLSYSGGILGIISLINSYLVENGFVNKDYGFFAFIYNHINLDVTALMAIVAIMHLIEAMLVYIDGDTIAIPIYIKKEDKVVGGFIMQRFWLVPAIFYVIATNINISGELFQTPNWWPIIRPDLPANILEKAIVAAAPIFIILGYGDFTVAQTPKEKVKKSSKGLLLFSFSLLVLSFISSKVYYFKYIAVLFAPICHELLIAHEKHFENKCEPIYTYKNDGVLVFDTLSDSPAEKMNINSGDKIISINNTKVLNLGDVEEILNGKPPYIWVELIDHKGKKKVSEFKDYKNGVEGLGILTIPKYSENAPIINESGDIFKK